MCRWISRRPATVAPTLLALSLGPATGPAVGLVSALVGIATPLGAQTTRWTGVQPGPDLNDRVRAMVEGPEGRVWMGVESGLRSFDGYRVEVFRAGPGSVASFPQTPVESLFVDREGRLWVGQRAALVQIDPARGTVDAVFRHDPDDPASLPVGSVSHMLQDPDGRLWVGTLDWSDRQASGLALLDPETGTVVRQFTHDPADPTSLSNNRIRSMVLDQDRNLWVATWSGLNRLPPGGDAFRRYRHDPADPGSLAYDDVMALHVDDGGTLWVATIGGGLHRYDPARDAFEHVPGSASPSLMTLTADGSGPLWLGTLDRGLERFDPTRGTFEHVDLARGGAPWPRINATIITRDDVLWVATSRRAGEDAGAVLRIDLQAPELHLRAASTPVRAILGTDASTIWYGDGGALVRWSVDEGRDAVWTCPGLGAPNVLEWLSSLLRAPDGTLWVGYWDRDVGLCRIDPDAAEPTLEPFRPPSADPLGQVWDMAWAEDRLWLATATGVVWLDPASGVVEAAGLETEPVWQQPGSVVAIETGPGGALWMVRQDGRVLRKPAGGPLEAAGSVLGPDESSGRVVGVAHFDEAGGLWVGTDGRGLCAFDPTEGRCGRWLDTSTGLPTDYVEDFTVDDRGHLWVSTFTGLTEIEPGAGPLRTLPTPGSSDPGAFQPGGAWASADGRVAAFGLERAILRFEPAGAAGNPHPPRIRIDRVEAVGAGDLDLSTAAPELASSDRDLIFEYTGLHFADPASNTYAYRLDGQEEAWRQVGTERRARYTNLAPGSYRFRVRAASANGVWSDEAVFAFHILSPWWRRPWALILWTSLALGTLVLVRAMELRRRRFAATLDREQAEARRLRELADTRSRLFANLSHEYRTPLALILGQIESAREDRGAVPGTVAGTDSKLDMAERQTRELQRLTDELLELSRYEAGALELDLRAGDLVELVRRAVADFSSAADAAGVELRVESHLDTLMAHFDPDRMRRVVNNLLSNALKFTPHGGEIVARVREVPRGDSGDGNHESHDGAPAALVAVEDTGVGIPPEARTQIFDRFYQVAARPGAPAGGTGIGLALVRELVELHGGTITVESELGRGTRFDIRLPLDRDGATLDTPPAAAPTAPDDADREPDEEPDAVDGEPPIVLIVEDHEDTRAFLRQELVTDYRIEEAADGAAGLARAIELVPDLVITDVGMPGMDGKELARRLRADERTSHVPIVMLTGRVSDDARVEGLESGVDDYLGKPFSARVLRSRVHSLLELRRLLRARYAGELWLKPEEVGGTSLDQKFLASVSRVIEERMADQGFSVEELAAAVAMSRSQLHRKLTALLGQAPGTLVRGMRLQRAADLIEAGSHSLGRIAYETGFSDQAHFTRSFKRHFGCTPGEYRERGPE